LTTDTFAYGQWVKAKIYQERCDLSPDGRHLLYFAMGFKEGHSCYYGISKAPYVKTLSLFWEGDTWSQGGHWVNSKTYWLDRFGAGESTGTGVRRVECPDWAVHPLIYRLKRDSWAHVTETKVDLECKEYFRDVKGFKFLDASSEVLWNADSSVKTYGTQHEFAKSLSFGWELRKLIHVGSNPKKGKGSVWEQHALFHSESRLQMLYPDWEWADYDAPRDRILYAEKGKIFAVKLTQEGLGEPIELFDSTQYGRDPVIAPY
jgi:hypothetical protein